MEVTDIGSSNRPPVVIAEVSANHLGSLSRAKALIAAAHDSGVNYVKFQHYRPDTISVRGDAPELTLSGGTIWDGRSLWNLYEEAMTPWEWTEELAAAAEDIGISWFSTPFDETAVDFLEGFRVPLYKIASFEIVDLPLIRHVASTGKPLIISTGMATIHEIDRAVEAARDSGAEDITLLRTNSAYPASVAEMDLSAIPLMREHWGVPVGLSDHTLGTTSAIVAAALGATVFEKHLTLARADGGPDAPFSAEPHELTSYVQDVRDAQASIGAPRFGPSPREVGSIGLRPSLRAVADIHIGERLSSDNVRSVRPGGGLEPDMISQLVGRTANKLIPMGRAITWEDID